MKNATRRAVLASLLAVVPALAHAGPPLLCFPMQTGGAPSLPWGGAGWNAPRAEYDRSRLAGDTIVLLAPDAPVLARMETLRRAVLYANGDAAAAKALFAALRARVHDADSSTRPLAQFDLGYALEAARQVRSIPGRSAGLAEPFAVSAPDEDGYALVNAALSARPDPEIAYAAALVGASRPSRADSDAHLRRAVAGARPGSALALTIAAHQALWGDRLTAHRATADR
jgi:hypothetical protein